jgi:DNA-binding Lrp family transcriptional regulator
VGLARRACGLTWQGLRHRGLGRRLIDVVAYVLIQTDVGVIGDVAGEIAGIKGVRAAEAVTGPYDVIARAEANSLDELGKLVIQRIQSVAGVTRTLTCPVLHE